MIAKWIAQALMRGDDHLILSTEELAKWHTNGCRVSLGAPWRLHGNMAVAAQYIYVKGLESLLIATPVRDWPVDSYTASCAGFKRTIPLPDLEVEPAREGKWKVPLIPSNPNHCLDSWAFDVALNDDELQAVNPIAARLAKRMLIRCEIKGVNNTDGKDVLWNEGRITLAATGGFTGLDLSELFLKRKSAVPINVDLLKE